MNIEFKGFKKIPRLYKNISITEKIDGTNGVIGINGNKIFAGSRTRWLDFNYDNENFYKWVMINRQSLIDSLGDGYHYGEWYGLGIQRGYGLTEKRFALFNAGRWNADTKPQCCEVVPLLYEGAFSEEAINNAILDLKTNGSRLVNGFMKPEGIVIYFHECKQLMKIPFDKN